MKKFHEPSQNEVVDLIQNAVGKRAKILVSGIDYEGVIISSEEERFTMHVDGEEETYLFAYENVQVEDIESSQYPMYPFEIRYFDEIEKTDKEVRIVAENELDAVSRLRILLGYHPVVLTDSLALDQVQEESPLDE